MTSDDRPCPICGYEAASAFVTGRRNVYRCRNRKCSHLFAAYPGVGQGVISANVAAEKQYDNYRDRNRRLIKYWLNEGFLRNGSRLLDVGSGYGHVVESIKSVLDVRIDCVEPASVYRERLEGLDCEVHTTIDGVPTDRGYDAALMMEVVEHLDDPIQVLASVRSRLRNRGCLFLSTPAGDFRKPLADPLKLSAYDDPCHIHFFTPRSLNLALRAAGFRRRQYRYILAMYLNEDMSEADYDSLWAKRYTWRKQFDYWRNGACHLTFFAS